MKIIKRDGRIVEYNREKIFKAIIHANNDVLEQERVNQKQIDNIIKHIEELNKKRMLVEDIQDMIETELMKLKKYELAKAYIIYRYKRALVRKSNITDESILSLIKNNNNNAEDNEHKNQTIISQRHLIANIVSKDLTKRILLPEKISEAHDEGILYFHDAEYFLQPSLNSCLINYQDMLENGTIINNQVITPPQSFQEACTILNQILLNATCCQYGGMSLEIKHLGKYLKLTEDNIINMLKNCSSNEISRENLIKTIFQNELSTSIQSFYYQLNTIKEITNISYPINLFLSLEDDDLYIEYTSYIIEELFKQALHMNEHTVENYHPPFKIIYALNENNYINSKKYHYITQMALKYLQKYQNLSFISTKIMNENYEGNIFSPLSNGYILSPFKDKNNQYKFEGRFTQGTVSINLPQIGIISLKNENLFWQLLDERLDLCFEALMCRYHALLGTFSTVSPIHWQYGAIARLNSNEVIDSLLKNGYSTLNLGYIGLNEIVRIMKNLSLNDKEGENFALKIIKFLRTKCDNWRKETGLGFCLYGHDSKNIGKYFSNIDQEKYGIIKNITDKAYYSNYDSSNNLENNLFNKLIFEKKLQDLSNGGSIIYIDIQQKERLDNIIKFIYENILYVEFIKNSDE